MLSCASEPFLVALLAAHNCIANHPLPCVLFSVHRGELTDSLGSVVSIQTIIVSDWDIVNVVQMDCIRNTLVVHS